MDSRPAMCEQEWLELDKLRAENEHHLLQIGDLKIVRTLLNNEIGELRAGISWARGMCTDEAPHVQIDHFLGCVLAGRAQLPGASDELQAPEDNHG